MFLSKPTLLPCLISTIASYIYHFVIVYSQISQKEFLIFPVLKNAKNECDHANDIDLDLLLVIKELHLFF